MTPSTVQHIVNIVFRVMAEHAEELEEAQPEYFREILEGNIFRAISLAMEELERRQAVINDKEGEV